MSLIVSIDGQRLEHGDVQFTLADPGGCETAQITVTLDSPPPPGAPVMISDGLTPLWYGRVEEPGHRGGGKTTVGCVGAKAELSDRRIAMIYISRDLSLWTGPDVAVQASYGASNVSPMAFPEPVLDPASGEPGLRFAINGEIFGASGNCSAYFDAGSNCQIGRVVWTGYNQFNTGTVAPWLMEMYSGTSGNTVAVGEIVDCVADAQTLKRDTPFKVPSRVVMLRFKYNGTYTADAWDRWRIYKNLHVLGDHSVPTIPAPGDKGVALRTSDVLRDILTRSGMRADYQIDDCSVPILDLIYRDLVPHQQGVDDILKLTGWHFGVWPPSSVMSDRPVILFCAPPQKPTCVVRYNDLIDPDITEHRSSMFSRANVTFTVPGDGTTQSIQVSRPHPRIPTDQDSTIDVDAGLVGSADVASTYALYVLALSQVQSRASGSVTLPPFVRTADGGIRASHTLRPGIDRLQVIGMPTDSQILADPPARIDSFRISRIVVEDGSEGVVTTAELDQGADLIEVLQARFAKSDPTGVLAG